MKAFRLILSAVMIWGLCFSCNNEINIFPENEPDRLFVLGCLDGSGVLHQVKIRKLVHGNSDGTVLINDPALYLPDTSLRVYLSDPAGRPYAMNPVLYPPQTGGPFSQDSNLIYELPGYRLAPGQSYTLKIDNPAMGQTLTAATIALQPAEFTYPVAAAVVHGKYRFTDYDRPFYISYSPAPVLVWTISFKYLDVFLTGDTLFRKVTFAGAPLFPPQKYWRREFQLAYLFGLMKKLIPVDPGLDYRLFYRFDFTIWTGSDEIAGYLEAASRFNDNRKQYFSNIQGGTGLFYSVSHAVLKDVCPLEAFTYALSISDSTRQLKFVRFMYNGPFTDPDSTLLNPFLSPVQ